MKPRHVCHGGPLHGAAFDIKHDDKTVIRSGDLRPGQYRRTGRFDDAGRTVWKFEPTPAEKAQPMPIESHA